MSIRKYQVHQLRCEIKEWLEIAEKITNPTSPPDVSALHHDIFRTLNKFAAHMITDGIYPSFLRVELWSFIRGQEEDGKKYEELTTSLKDNLSDNFPFSVPIHIQDAVYHDERINDYLASIVLQKIGNIGLLILQLLGEERKNEIEFLARYGNMLEQYVSLRGVLYELPKGPKLRD